MPITIFPVDDDNDFLDGLTTLFDLFKDQYQVVGSYRTIKEPDDVDDLVDTIDYKKPDVVLMDLDFRLIGQSDVFGIDLIRAILKLCPDQKIIVLANGAPFTNDELFNRIKRSFQVGAIAYLRKDEPHTWMDCIQEIANSNSTRAKVPVPETIQQMIVDRFLQADAFNLTDRQLEAVKLLSTDLTGTDIAERMGIKHNVVTEHINNAKIKFGVRTQPGLIAEAMRHGVIF